MKQTNFESLSIDELLNLRDTINRLLSDKFIAERDNLQSRMETLTKFGLREGLVADKRHRIGKIPAKYQNPDNPDELWAGRGKTPRWMVAALRKGKKKEDFLLDRRALSPKTSKK